MSDTGRKNFTDKIEETVTPDSQKSYLEQAKETATNAYDHAAAKLAPTEDKSVSQHAADTLSGAKDDVSKAASGSEVQESYLEQGKHLLSEAQKKGSEYASTGSEQVKSAISQAGDYIHNLQGGEKK